MAGTETAADEVRSQIGDLLERAVRRLRLVLVGSVVTVGLLVLVLGAVLRITSDTNQVVRDEVVVLQDRNTELEDQHAVDADLLAQSTDAIVLLIQTLQANGIEPPEIVIRPTTTTTEPGG